jgi:hypothetical protein
MGERGVGLVLGLRGRRRGIWGFRPGIEVDCSLEGWKDNEEKSGDCNVRMEGMGEGTEEWELVCCIGTGREG